MKNIVIASIIAIASATTASAYTCKNTAEIINGETVYTYSQCGNQAPASQTTLDQMSYAANNNESDEVVEEVVEEAVVEEAVVEEVVVVATAVVAPTQTREVLSKNNKINKWGNRVVTREIKITKATGKVVYLKREVTFNKKHNEKRIRVKNLDTGKVIKKTTKTWKNKKPAVKS